MVMVLWRIGEMFLFPLFFFYMGELLNQIRAISKSNRGYK